MSVERPPSMPKVGGSKLTLGMRHVARRQVSSCLTVSLDTGLSYPLGTGPSIDDAFYPWWGLDVLSNERRLTGECRCRYDSRLKYLTIAEPLMYLELLVAPIKISQPAPLSGPRSFNVNPCHIPPGTDKNY